MRTVFNMMNLRSSISLPVRDLLCCAFVILATQTHIVTAKDQVVDWAFGMRKGGAQVDVLQCQSVTFDWSTGDGMRHDVWEFLTEEAYDACDFNGTTKLTEQSLQGKHVLENEDTLGVTKRWFGCRVGSHCQAGNMKIAVKIRPLLVDKFFQSECVGGTSLIARNEDDTISCRKRCKRKRGCIALEWNSDAQKNCKLFSAAPERTSGRANVNAQCEVAATTCVVENGNSEDGGGVNFAVPAPAPGTVSGPTAPCEIDMRVRCKLLRDTTVTNIDCENIPMEGQCTVKVRYLYFVHTLKPGGTTLQSLTRSRKGAAQSNGGDNKNMLIDNNGVSSVGKTVSDWVLNAWEEESVDLCSTNTYDTKVELVTRKISTGQVCSRSESLKFSTSAANAPDPAAVAEQCQVTMDMECIVCISNSGCGGTDCNYYANPQNGCTKRIRYKYRFTNGGSSFITVKSAGRTRTGESNLPLGGTNYIMPKGNTQFYGEDIEFNFCDDGEKTTVFEATVVCGGRTETFTADYKLIY